ncbi:hypothetical protein D3C87_1530400 [compost metagenome]
MQRVALHNGQPHQLAAAPGRLIEHGLHDARQAGAAQILLAQQGELQRQAIAVGFGILLNPSERGHFRQQPMRRAFLQVQCSRNVRQAAPLTFYRQQFDDFETSLQ